VNLVEGVREVLGITFPPVDNLASGFSGPDSILAKPSNSPRLCAGAARSVRVFRPASAQ